MRKILLYISLMVSVLATAQVVSDFPYECSFEKNEDLSAWQFNVGTSAATDKWIVDSITHSEGRRSLYISSDGVNPVYWKNPNVVVSYVRLKFPTQSTGTQRYDVSFDWKGGKESTDSRLYVMFCAESELSDANTDFCLDKIVSTTRGVVPFDTRGICEGFEGYAEKSLSDGDRWQNVSLSHPLQISSTSSSETFVLVFIWENNNVNDSLHLSSIAIDNLQISTAALKKPKNVDAVSNCEDSTMLVTWESGLSEFEVQYRPLESSTWRRFSGIDNGTDGFTREDGIHCSYVLKRIAEGGYSVRVRGVAGDSTTNYVYKNSVLVFCPENHCVDYTDIHSVRSSNVECRYGSYNQTNEQFHKGVVDYGPDAMESRHTLHIDPSETDPRTDGLLHTVPKGAVASVRLGNWEVHSEAESITYDITVDSANQGILIVRYAIVFQDPSSHRGRDEELFKLEILDSRENLIDPNCGYANFEFKDASDWNTSADGTIKWKDWTYVGVNLQGYNGEDIKVRLTTMDCGQGAHFGYAYFTLDCISAYLETENCGNDPKIICHAPEGFYYKWTNEADEVVSESDSLKVDPSRQQYTCHLTSKEHPDCTFDLTTSAAPRWPVPHYGYDLKQEECHNKIEFHDSSFVENRYADYQKRTSERCADARWVCRRLSEVNGTELWGSDPVYDKCSPYGDSIEVTMTSYIGVDNACDSTRVDTIYVPSITTPDSIVQAATCPEHPFPFQGDRYGENGKDTTVVKVYTNRFGCDSTIILQLHVSSVPTITYVYDSICSDQSITIGGIKYSEPLNNKEITIQAANGCDSVINLTLTVNERLQATVNPMPYACADDEQLYVTFDIAAGVYDSIEIRFNTQELRDTVIYDKNVTTITIPYSPTITPGSYEATIRFHQYCCGVYEEKRNFDIRYRSSIVEQKWNDVLTLLSPRYNGGYEFTSFQWYKDDMPIPGETYSYLYQQLDMDATYYVELTRQDGVIMTTCPIQPVYHEQQTAYPTIVGRGQHLPMYMERAATIWYYTISSQLYSTFTLPQGYTSLPTPDQTGPFIIKSVDTEGETQAQVMIVQ